MVINSTIVTERITGYLWGMGNMVGGDGCCFADFVDDVDYLSVVNA